MSEERGRVLHDLETARCADTESRGRGRMTLRFKSSRIERSKIRLGPAAIAGSSLHQLGIREFDPAFGGRWNAGSNTPNLGTSIHPEAYKAELLKRLKRLGTHFTLCKSTLAVLKDDWRKATMTVQSSPFRDSGIRSHIF